MRIALNGYFWDRPYTGSGQYTRHLWGALSRLVSQLPDKDAHELGLLLPYAAGQVDGLNPKSKIQSLPLNDVKGPKSKIQNPKSKIGKLLWEERDVVQEAIRQGAQ